MNIGDYLRRAFRLTSMIFTTLMILNLLLGNKRVLFGSVEYILFTAGICGLLIFLTEDNGRYSDFRLIVNQIIYIGIVFLIIIMGDIIFDWKLGIRKTLIQCGVALLIYFFIKTFMYSHDKKDAEEINRRLKSMKEKQE